VTDWKTPVQFVFSSCPWKKKDSGGSFSSAETCAVLAFSLYPSYGTENILYPVSFNVCQSTFIIVSHFVRTETGVCKTVTQQFTESFVFINIPKQRTCKLSGTPRQLCKLRLCSVSHVESGISSLFLSREFCPLLTIKAHFFIIVAYIPWFPWPNIYLPKYCKEPKLFVISSPILSRYV